MEIKHGLYENGVKETFQLKVVSGNYAGIYDIEKPSDWDDIDCIIDIDKDYFNLNNLIIGDTNKIKFLEYYNKSAFDIVYKVYEEQGGDGQIVFYWKKEKNGVVYDILEENYALNLNKYKLEYEKSKRVISLEIKKRDEHNLLNVREDVSSNLFKTKNIDENEITPVPTTDIFYKEQAREYSNFYYFMPDQDIWQDWSYPFFMPLFGISESSEFGDMGRRQTCGMFQYSDGYDNYILPSGYFLRVNAQTDNVSVEVSNLSIYAPISFKFIIFRNESESVLKESEYNPEQGRHEINIQNEEFYIGTLLPYSIVDFLFLFDGGNQSAFGFNSTETSIKIKTKLETPIRKSKTVLLKDAVNQLLKQYGINMTIESSLIDNGGKFANTTISTGIFLRGVANIFLGEEKLTTSFKNLFSKCVSPMMALGYDTVYDKLIIENIEYFFKNLCSYDFSDKTYFNEDFSIENDSEFSYNTLVFGTKKYSTKNKGDLSNFNTTVEFTTPIKFIKNKFDKTSDCIVDEDKIQELIFDKSSSTNDNDDDLILIDLVELSEYIETGVLKNCTHYFSGGYLWLKCFESPFDTLGLSVGDDLTITSGVGSGTYQILEIDKYKLKLNKTVPPFTYEYTSDTPIRYTLRNILKNRNNEGFSAMVGVDNPRSVTNARHNPKYQMARWFPFFGGSLINKLDNENIIVSDYKNNGNVSFDHNGEDLSNEIPGLIKLNDNESLGRLRNYKTPFFSGKKINITLNNVSFDEFFNFYKNWRYGINNDRMTSRGYITVSVEGKKMNIYPFGEKSVSFSMKYNTLTINGRVKNIYYDDEPFRIFDEFFAFEFE